jgi:hypothetical protein
MEKSESSICHDAHGDINVGDAVMFKPAGTYAKWFGGHIGFIESISYGSDGKWHCRVRWMNPVKYYDSCSSISDFCLNRFQKHDC